MCSGKSTNMKDITVSASNHWYPRKGSDTELPHTIGKYGTYDGYSWARRMDCSGPSMATSHYRPTELSCSR